MITDKAQPSPRYQIVDKLFLWYLGNPKHPVLVGEINLMRTMRGASLKYSNKWLEIGFALSEDLPLSLSEHFPKQKECAAGAVDDARPDRWGEKVIRLIEKPERISIIEMLYFAGDTRFGALGVSTSDQSYLPSSNRLLPNFSDADDIHRVVQHVLAGEPIDEIEKRLISPGATMGGARPKALIQMKNAEWVLKFSEETTSFEPAVEHATMTLAALAGINSAQTQLITLHKGCAVAVKRFDRTENGNRIHAISANVALQAAGMPMSYAALSQLLRRKGVTENGMNQKQMRVLFKRMIFNILIDNTDDHEKNHVLLMNDDQTYTLAPAFDVLPTCHSLGYQSMQIGKNDSDSSVELAITTASSFGLTQAQARQEAAAVAKVIHRWQEHFAEKNVPQKTIAYVAQNIDSTKLKAQRVSLI